MRLGVVTMGTFAHAGACVGVLGEMEKRGIEPSAVCGMQGGAWPAALYGAGLNMSGMEKALHQAAGVGRKMIAPSVMDGLRPWRNRMPDCPRLGQLLLAQTGQRALGLCPRAALFPCRMAKNAQRVVFSTRAFIPERGAMLAMQATAAFAARAAMALPPFLSPLPFMGAPLLGETDAAFAAQLLLGLGVHRVLIIAPQLSPRRASDAVALAGAAVQWPLSQPMREEVGVLRIAMPESVGPLAYDRLEACCEAGRLAAQRELDGIFERMGMAFCRVLPFRARMM